MRILKKVAGSAVLVTVLLAGGAAGAEDEAASTGSCRDGKIVSVPSRPTVSNAADTTQCGVIEAEYGLERQWPGAGVHRDDLSGGLRFGLRKNIDLHWSSADFLHIDDAGGSRTGFGDTWLGVKYRFLDQSGKRPGLGFFYQVKIPAGEDKGLSTGRVDQSFGFLVSKDIHPVHFDFNLVPLLAGRPTGSGYDHNLGFALSGSLPVGHGLSLVGEGYGATALNAATPGFGSAMIGFTYQANPRLTFDTGFDVGATHDAPKKRVFVGITLAMANVYALMKKRK